MVIPDAYRLTLDGDEGAPIPVRITIGDKTMIALVAIALALALKTRK
jgi:hypothetical protein